MSRVDRILPVRAIARGKSPSSGGRNVRQPGIPSARRIPRALAKGSQATPPAAIPGPVEVEERPSFRAPVLGHPLPPPIPDGMEGIFPRGRS
jgi:hypothetical protein